MKLLNKIKDTFLNALESKKFWYAVIAIFLLFFSDNMGISDQAVNNVVLIAIALLVSQGIADNKCKK
mgnify:CR=1 FL=1|tara:strand:+ start:1113 stop:1313 length:201 start_codon:yes stop_codon:yes gene_type:complete